MRVIAIQVQQHVVSTVADFGAGMSHQIVEKLVTSLEFLLVDWYLWEAIVLTARRMVESTVKP